MIISFLPKNFIFDLRLNDKLGTSHSKELALMVFLTINLSPGGESTKENAFLLCSRFIPSFEALEVSIDLTNMENACKGSVINYLEHVEVKVNLNYSRRGDLEMKVSSPMGTVSNLTHFRYADSRFKNKVLKNWVVMTLHLWGETAKGKWTLTLKNSQTKRAHKGWFLTFITKSDIRFPMCDIATRCSKNLVLLLLLFMIFVLNAVNVFLFPFHVKEFFLTGH